MADKEKVKISDLVKIRERKYVRETARDLRMNGLNDNVILLLIQELILDLENITFAKKIKEVISNYEQLKLSVLDNDVNAEREDDGLIY